MLGRRRLDRGPPRDGEPAEASEAGGTPARTEGFGRVDGAQQRSPIHISEDDVYRSEDRDGIRNEAVFEQPRQDLQVHEGKTTHLRSERVRAASIADHVDADLALRALDGVIGLALRALPDMTEPRSYRTAG